MRSERKNRRLATERRALKTSESVAMRIVEDIVAPGLTTGAHLPAEASMLTQYGVSRASLREALRLLEVQGLITLKPGPGGGPEVGSIDATNLARTATLYFQFGGMTYDELFEAQVLLEPLCAEMAARNGDPDEMRAAFAPLVAPGHPMEGQEFYDRTHDFHLLVYQFAGNRVLTLLTAAISHIVTSHVLATMDPLERRDDVVAEHQQLAVALTRGQATRAHKLMTEHYRNLVDYYRKHWPSRFDVIIEWR